MTKKISKRMKIQEVTMNKQIVDAIENGWIVSLEEVQ